MVKEEEECNRYHVGDGLLIILPVYAMGEV
jgi:hypothetical protein